MSITFIEDLDELDFYRVCEIYDNCGWGKKTIDDARIIRTETVFKQSFYFSVACDVGGNYLGFVRALSDNIATSWIAELVVIESAQRTGVGSQIFAKAKENLGHTDIYLEIFSGKEKFFELQGLKSRPKMVVCSRGKSSSRSPA